MPLHLIRQDITKMDCDAIVCPTDTFFSASGGADMQIHAAAGPLLMRECRAIGCCPPGEAVLTKGYMLPAKNVIHTAGPIWQGGSKGEEELLRSCYKSCLSLAVANGFETVALPIISAGTYGYPKAEAFKCAMSVLSDFLLRYEITVFLLVYDKEVFQISERLISHIEAFITDEEAMGSEFCRSEAPRRFSKGQRFSRICAMEGFAPTADPMESEQTLHLCEAHVPPAASAEEMQTSPCHISMGSIDKALKEADESFSQMLLRKIDESGMTDSQCYKKANIDRKLFSKIRSDLNYRPKKTTAIAFAIALELSREETDLLLKKAGLALSHSNKFDIIVEYFIDRGIYDIFALNEVLFAYDQSLIGA